ncbi:MAG TPA: Fic family protein [Elusimicrobiales bacterium]|nr:Fic family protein [Elusimicrobiales bacterium]
MKNFKAGLYKQQLKYKSFFPNKINIPLEITDKQTSLLLEKAGMYLGELNAYSVLVPNIDIFIKMHVYKEAILSSRIEGTQTTLEEAVMPAENIYPEKKNDWQEIQNYTIALNEAIGELQKLPVSMRLVNRAHKALMRGVRGTHKNPGKIRTSQNWIGGSNLKDAFFIPPHQNDLPELLSDLERFWHNENLQIPTLIKIAIFHYQFETIHPFLDGNGRIGRLLIPLMLVSKNIISKPVLYISDFFERNKGSYYDSLTMVRASNDITQWVKFFLNGMIETSKKGTRTLSKIIDFRKTIDRKLLSLGKKANMANKLVMELFSNPFVNAKETSQMLNTSRPTAANLLFSLEKIKILKEMTGKKRNKEYIFNGYLSLFK